MTVLSNVNLQGVQPQVRDALALLDAAIPASVALQALQGTVWYVDSVAGADVNDGLSWGEAFATMANALSRVASGDTIIFRGRISEECTTPVNVMDVTIIGAGPSLRHADASPAGGNKSAQWGPVGTTVPLLKIIQQGWVVHNVLFDAPTSAAAVQLFRNGGAGDAERDAGHSRFYDCRFLDGSIGIEESGGVGHIRIERCEFTNLTHAIKSTTGAGIGQPLLRSTIRDCQFRSNTNHLISGSQEMHVIGNIFGPGATKAINLSGGVGSNVVTRNTLFGTYGDTLYTEGTSDNWNGNFASTGLTAAVPA